MNIPLPHLRLNKEQVERAAMRAAASALGVVFCLVLIAGCFFYD